MVLIRVISDFTNKNSILGYVLKISIAFAITLIFLTGCSNSSDSVLSNSGNDTSDSNDKVASQGIEQYVKIYTGTTSEDHFDFYYDLFDKTGTLIKHDCTYMDEPDISMPSKDMIKISVQTGTGLSTRWTYYFDLSANVFSRTFYHVLAEKENMVAYYSDKKIIVSDIFNEEKFTKEIKLKHDVSNCTDPIESITFSDDLSQINITYLSGTEFQEINETVLLK